MTGRIVILGANGQVGSEVCVRLAAVAGLDVVAVSRTRIGSALLRRRGVAVRHGAVDDAAQAPALLEGAAVVANFALAGGTGRAAVLANNKIISTAIKAAPRGAVHLFFSTLAVAGEWGPSGKAIKSSYGLLKLGNERHFLRAIARHKAKGWVVRLGHVLGQWQNILSELQADAATGCVLLPDPDRGANVTCVETICEIIARAAAGADAPIGQYDAVDDPQPTWRDVYTDLGGPATRFETLIPATPPARRQGIPSGALRWIANAGLRPAAEKVLMRYGWLPGERIRAAYMVSRAAQEIAALSAGHRTISAAAWWPAHRVRPFPGIRDIRTIRAAGDYPMPPDSAGANVPD